MERDDYYRILGVSRYASRDAVKRAFRSRVPAVHPDRNPNEPRAAENTRKLVEAYRMLVDPQRRRNYDLADARHARPVVVTTERARNFHSPSGSRALTAILSALVVICLAVLVARGILAEQPPAFRPFVGAIDLSAQNTEEPIIICLHSPDQFIRDPMLNGKLARTPASPAAPAARFVCHSRLQLDLTAAEATKALRVVEPGEQDDADIAFPGLAGR